MDLVLIAQVAVAVQTASQLLFALRRECLYKNPHAVFIGVVARLLASSAAVCTLYYAGALSRIWQWTGSASPPRFSLTNSSPAKSGTPGTS
jgi:hypothetical protein